MASEQVTTGPVELRYTLTTDDLLDGVVAQLRGIRRRWLAGLLMVPPLLGVAIGLGRSEVWELPAKGILIVAAACLVLILVVAALSLLLHRLLLRGVYRWQVRLIMRGNPWLSQPVRTTVTDLGVHVSNPTGESRSSWSQYPLYVETDRSFVLLASRGLGAMALVLPKQGLAGEDAARLRALLDARSHRRT